MAFGFENFFKEFGKTPEEQPLNVALSGTDVHHPRLDPERHGYHRTVPSEAISSALGNEGTEPHTAQIAVLPPEYSRRTSPRFLIPRDEQAERSGKAFAGLPAPKLMADSFAEEERGAAERQKQAEQETRNKEVEQLFETIYTVDASIQELIVETYGLESVEFDGRPVLEVVETLMRDVSDLDERLEETDLSRAYELLIQYQQTLNSIHATLERQRVLQQKPNPNALESIRESTGGRMLSNYSHREVEAVWQSAGFDLARRVEMLEWQVRMWEQCRVEIENLDGWLDFEPIANGLKKAYRLDESARTNEIKDELQAIKLAGGERNQISDGKWIRKYFFAYHELLAAAQSFLINLKAQRRRERDERRKNREPQKVG